MNDVATVDQPPTNHAPTTNTPDTPQLFDVPDFALARGANSEAYKNHILELHRRMRKGNSTDYVEAKIALPRSLQGLKTGQVVAKLFALNPTLDSEDWSTVTADIVGTNLVIGTVSDSGRTIINELAELKVEPGRAAKVPAAAKPNNLYYVEILLPYERELHIDFMEAFLRKFPSAKYIQMPGLKAWGTDRRLRLFFNTTTAPREVFTEEDSTIPIREITLQCGTAAQIIHKWQKLNQFRPPHLLNRWRTQTPAQSYAAAITGNGGQRPTNHLPPQRPGVIANGPPPYIQPNTNPGFQTAQVIDDEDWTSNAPLLPTTPNANTRSNAPTMYTQTPPDVPMGDKQRHDSTSIETQVPTNCAREPPAKHTTNAIPHPHNMATIGHHTANPNATTQSKTPTHQKTQPNTQHQPTDRDHVSGSRSTNGTKPHPPIATTQTNTPQPPNTLTPASNPQPNNDTTTGQNQGTQAPTPMEAETSTTGAPAQQKHSSHPAPSRSRDNLAQWQQVTRARTRKQNEATPPSTNQNNPTITKSTSRNRKLKTGNKFAMLDVEVFPTYEDDAISPISVTLPTTNRRPSRRKYKGTRKAWTKEVTNASSHPQQVRHPMHTLQHLSPHQTQVFLRSANKNAKPLRDRLLHQIALLRAVRSNTTQQNILLQEHADDAFMRQVQTRLTACQDSPPCITTTPVDIPLRAILDQDELRMRGALCFAWVDLATRAMLPTLYDVWPETPSWHGTPLRWLAAPDEETPCLQDEALAALAACPTLQNAWKTLTKDTPDLEFAVQTAANQWRLHISNLPTHRTGGATPTQH